MKVLLSSIGSRGDVQPILALAIELHSLGHHARLCVAPNFRDWVVSFGIECLPIGPDLERLVSGTPSQALVSPSNEQRRQLAAQAVRSQFPILMDAARDRDLVVAGGMLQFAPRSVSEALEIPCVFTAYCPAVFPSPHHPPPKLGARHSQSLSEAENVALWEQEERSWNDLFRDTLNDERAKLGLEAIGSVHRHILTDRPWLAADPFLGPTPAVRNMQIAQTGAWLLRDPRPLPEHVETFLADGPAPVYFGFGSMRAAEETSRVLVESARTLGMRSIISRGWGNLHPIDDGSDCLLIEDVPHETLLSRVAVAVHHGGAGTTTAAAAAGVPQVIVPHLYDQFYWAQRVQQVGIGASGPTHDALTVEGIASSLQVCMKPETRERARSLARRIERHGARAAAQRLIETYAAYR